MLAERHRVSNLLIRGSRSGRIGGIWVDGGELIPCYIVGFEKRVGVAISLKDRRRDEDTSCQEYKMIAAWQVVGYCCVGKGGGVVGQ